MNMKFAAVAALGALSLAAIAPQAAAADNGFYIGAGITQTEIDVDDFGDDVSLDDNSFKLMMVLTLAAFPLIALVRVERGPRPGAPQTAAVAD